MKFVALLLVATTVSAADPTPCDPTKLKDGCLTGWKCAVNTENKNTCVKKEQCGQGVIKCSDNGDTCDWTEPNMCSDNFKCATNDINKNTCVPTGACGVDSVVCSDVGEKCDSTVNDNSTCSGVNELTRCQTAPPEGKDKCIPSTKCGTSVWDVKYECAGTAITKCDPTKIKDGCAAGERCAINTANKDTCVKKESCDSGDIKCSALGQPCKTTSLLPADMCVGDFKCAINSDNKDTCVPSGACTTDPVKCSDVKGPCKAADGTGCTKDVTTCAVAGAYKNECVPNSTCGTTVMASKVECKDPGPGPGPGPTPGGKTCDANADNSGCDDNMSCATAPPDLAKTCVATETCGTVVPNETIATTCGASTLLATTITALAFAATM